MRRINMLNLIPKPRKLREFEGSINIENRKEIKIRQDYTLSEEGYRIKIQSSGVEIFATDEAGVFYAKQTLLQLEDGGKLPCCEIEDEPRFRYRGFMLDVSRHFVSVSYIKHILDILAYFKMNVFHWHLSDDHGFRMDFSCYPKLKEASRRENTTKLPEIYEDESYHRGYYTRREVQDVIAYASERCITIIPEIDMPGHLSAILNVYEEFSCDGKKRSFVKKGGVQNSVGCIGNSEFIQFSINIIRELCTVFPSKYIHLGGDEVPTKSWKMCPKCQEVMLEQGFSDERELQIYYEGILARECKKYGRIPIMWNDIVDEKMDSDIVSHFWTVPLLKTGREQAKEMKKQLLSGRMHIMSCHDRSYLDMPYKYNTLKHTYEYEPTKMPNMEDLSTEATNNIIGISCNMWTEYTGTKERLEYHIFPRFFAYAEVAWSIEKDYTGFLERLDGLQKKLEEFDLDGADRSCYKSEYNYIRRNLALIRYYWVDKDLYGDKEYNKYLERHQKE